MKKINIRCPHCGATISLNGDKLYRELYLTSGKDSAIDVEVEYECSGDNQILTIEGREQSTQG